MNLLERSQEALSRSLLLLTLSMPKYVAQPFIEISTAVLALRSARLRKHYQRSFAVLPEAKRKQFGSAQSLARLSLKVQVNYWREVVQATRGRAFDDVEVAGVELLRASLAKGCGVVALLSHSGNPECVAGQIALELECEIMVVAEAEPDQLMRSLVNAGRESLGLKVLSFSKSDDDSSNVGLQAALAIRRHLARNQVYAALIDYAPRGRHFVASAAGQEIDVSAMAGLAAVDAHAPVHPVETWYEMGAIRGMVHPAVPSDFEVIVSRAERADYLVSEAWKVLSDSIDRNPVSWRRL